MGMAVLATVTTRSKSFFPSCNPSFSATQAVVERKLGDAATNHDVYSVYGRTVLCFAALPRLTRPRAKNKASGKGEEHDAPRDLVLFVDLAKIVPENSFLDVRKRA